MRQAAIANVLLADRYRARPAGHNVVACFSCGRTYLYEGRQGELNGRFCSLRCQTWCGAGNPSFEQQSERKIVYRWRDGRPMKTSAHGFVIVCAGCSKEFDSKGLRCCSTECERRYRERQDNLAVMAEVGMEPLVAKRLCVTCGTRIPTWRNGRKVTSAARFCSSKCGQKARRASAGQTLDLSVQTAQNPNTGGAFDEASR